MHVDSGEFRQMPRDPGQEGTSVCPAWGRTLNSRVRGSLSLLRQGLREPSAAACELGRPSGGMLGSSGVPSLWVYLQGSSGEVLGTSGFCERGKIRVKWGGDSTGRGGPPAADWPSSDDCVTVNQWCFP